jgi:transglutaminase-like putative cysteine protease
MDFVHKRLAYAAKSITVHTHMRDVLSDGMGVCEDFGHVLLGLCRSLLIPARYVSSYVATETDKGATERMLTVSVEIQRKD